MIEILAFVLLTAASAIGAVYVLAYLDLFFTIVREGEIKVVMCFGDPRRAIINYDGWVMDGWDVEPGPTKKRFFGAIYWVGVPPFRTIHRYTFHWATLKMKAEEGKEKGTLEATVYREEKISFIYAKRALYVLEMNAVEVKGMVPLDLKVVLTACCVNPHKALFTVHDWLVTMANLILPHLRTIVAESSFDEIVREKVAVMKKVSEEIKKTLGTKETKELDGTTMIEKFRQDFGIKMLDFDLSDITPSNPEDGQYAVKEWRAQQEAKEAIAKAEGTKQATITIAEGVFEETRLRAKAMSQLKHGELAARLRTAEIMAEIGKEGQKTIIMGRGVTPEELAPSEYTAGRLGELLKEKAQKESKSKE